MIKEYVLKIGFDSSTEEVEYIKEYIDNCRAILEIDDEKFELDEEIVDCLESDIIGIS